MKFIIIGSKYLDEDTRPTYGYLEPGDFIAVVAQNLFRFRVRENRKCSGVFLRTLRRSRGDWYGNRCSRSAVPVVVCEGLLKNIRTTTRGGKVHVDRVIMRGQKKKTLH